MLSGPFDEESLPKLKKQFVQEAKRNLFTVFTRPRKTIINLISTTTSSAGAFPFGEAFEFSFSPGGLWCLAKSSSRIVVIDIAAEEPVIKRELKVVRKPLAAYILQNGTILGVLSSSHKVNIYDLEDTPKLIKTVALDEEAHSLALSSHGEVLAVAYDGGVEVSSLLDHALPTDKRAVKSDRVDSLSFSVDGTMLLGTTQLSKNASTVIISAPYFTETSEEMPQGELISHMWTSQILFPCSSRDCSHAALLPRQMDHDANWTLTYDRVYESFRAVRTDDLRNGHTYFAGPKPATRSERQHSKSILTPCTLPAITEKGELVAAGFLGNEVWLYGVPEDLDNHALSVGNSPIEAQFPEPGSPVEERHIRSDVDSLPRWQVLVDKYRNVFAKGRRITTVSNVNQMCWVSNVKNEKGLQNVRERLVIGAPGGVSIGDDLEQEEMASVDGGRLVLLDFDWCPKGGQTKEITIEIGLAEPEKLEEQSTDMATEIAIVRRRTVARRDGIPRSHVASVADVLRPADEPAPPVPSLPRVGFGLDVSTPSPTSEEPGTPVSPTHAATLQEAANSFDGPYSHTSPRSRNTLYRSATAVEASRRRAPPILPASGVVEYRRTDGTEMPHESDADNWVPPPPPYTKDADYPLPDDLRQTLLPGQSQGPSSALGASFRRPLRSFTTLEQMAFRRRSSADIDAVSYTSSSRHSIAAISLEAGGRNEINSPISNAQYGGSPLSAGIISPLAPIRRSLSTYETRSNRSSMYRAALRPAEPIAPVSETSSMETPSQALDVLSTSPSIPSRSFRSSSLTLSGTNLQERLDYPLPHPPQPRDTNDFVEESRPISTSTRPINDRSEAWNSSTLSRGEPSVTSSISTQSPAAIASEPVTTPAIIETGGAVTVPNSELSAYASNSAQFARMPQSPRTSEAPAETSSRFRSAFRRTANRTMSQPHLRSVSAMNFTSSMTGSRSNNARLNTIYDLGSDVTGSTNVPSERTSYRPATSLAQRRETHYERPTVQTQIYSTRPVSRSATSRVQSGLVKRISQFRGRSEDPNQLSLASHRAAPIPENDTISGYDGRGRRRARGHVDSEVWEDVYPQTQIPAREETKKRKGGGKCIVM